MELIALIAGLILVLATATETSNALTELALWIAVAYVAYNALLAGFPLGAVIVIALLVVRYVFGAPPGKRK